MSQSQEFTMQPVARIRSEFAEKFGVPRQSGLVAELEAEIVFEPAYRNPDALRGLEEFSHVWLIWVFDRAIRETWSPTVRPPRLGGNARMGVFATRSPFRPNPIALSCVKLAGIRQTADGPVIRVLGADLVDGTPILDIKPYIPYADSHPDAMGGFASVPAGETLEVIIPPELLARIPEAHREALRGVLAQDPRPPLPERPGADLRVPLCGNGSPFFCGRNPADRPGHPENPLTTHLPAGCFFEKTACCCIFPLTLINIVIRWV